MKSDFFMESVDGKICLTTYTGDSEVVEIPMMTTEGAVQVIGSSVFSENKTIKEVIVPFGVERISTAAFRACSNLERVTIPDTVTIIEEEAFRFCVKLRGVELPSALHTFGDSAFSDCDILEKITIPLGVTRIPYTLFQGCKNLKEVFLPETVCYMESGAFQNCESLESINFPPSLRGIGSQVFENCSSLKEIELPRELNSVYYSGFSGCKQLKKVTVHGEKIIFQDDAFDGCDALQIYNYRFISGFTLQTQLTYTFRALENRSIFPEKDVVELISYLKRKRSLKLLLFVANQHSEISFLLEHNFKFTLEELDEILEETVKNNRPAITAIFLEYKKKHFSQKEMELFQERKELLEIGLEYPNKKEFKKMWRCSAVPGGLQVSGYKGEESEVVLPACLDDGTKIVKLTPSQNGFINLRKLVIEAEIFEIAPKTFRFCRNLEEIVLPDTVVEIGEKAFSYCMKLKEIRIPDQVSALNKGAFEYCCNLEKVYGCENLQFVKENAFSCCTSLKQVQFTEKLRSVEIFAFFLTGVMEEMWIPEAMFLEKPDFFHSMAKNVIVV